jgi:hypothetical protein
VASSKLSRTFEKFGSLGPFLVVITKQSSMWKRIRITVSARHKSLPVGASPACSAVPCEMCGSTTEANTTHTRRERGDYRNGSPKLLAGTHPRNRAALPQHIGRVVQIVCSLLRGFLVVARSRNSTRAQGLVHRTRFLHLKSNENKPRPPR